MGGAGAGGAFGGGGLMGGGGFGGTPSMASGGGMMMGMGGMSGGFQHGMIGYGGYCGFGGCCGGMPCNFGGCMGCFPCGMMGGCMGGAFYGLGPTQTYAKWSDSPGKAYYYRTLQITPSALAPNDKTHEFIVVYYPERPKYFYYFEPVAKAYVGRYVLGSKGENCFSLLNPADRKANLKSIPENAFRGPGTMPTLPQLVNMKSPSIIEPGPWQTLRLNRPPESVPNELLGLPPDEELPAKKSK